jgi:hypothetical protein
MRQAGRLPRLSLTRSPRESHERSTPWLDRRQQLGTRLTAKLACNDVAGDCLVGPILAKTRLANERFRPTSVLGWEIVANLFRILAVDNGLVSFLGGVTRRGSNASAAGDAAPCGARSTSSRFSMHR